jgi:cation transport ATPase
MSGRGREIRRRFPRIVMNLVMAVIFWIVSVFVPPTVKDIAVPGIDVNADFLVWVLAIVILAIFLIRALSDSMVLADIVTDVIVRKLGIKEERSPKRAARDFLYIIIIILIVTAVSPILAHVEDIGYLLSTAATYVGLALIIIFLYDIGRVLYKIVEQKSELLADRLEKIGEKNKKE